MLDPTGFGAVPWHPPPGLGEPPLPQEPGRAQGWRRPSLASPVRPPQSRGLRGQTRLGLGGGAGQGHRLPGKGADAAYFIGVCKKETSATGHVKCNEELQSREVYGWVRVVFTEQSWCLGFQSTNASRAAKRCYSVTLK